MRDNAEAILGSRSTVKFCVLPLLHMPSPMMSVLWGPCLMLLCITPSPNIRYVYIYQQYQIIYQVEEMTNYKKSESYKYIVILLSDVGDL